ncbi:MAG: DUF5317 family protein [Armatimonadota bacterium]|nr:DUF5317 family protein [Armatimonadota bacterium]MDR7427468.1 DUF5317 family protein [Armatimonadota bacterium]MDR7463826.1 DUF5317 family protein [Armatimonadota bacterium]MDR7469972.1 DUF5317 family protein [Armatimonadota bacterium]MDR7474478.1 DUF5317 family protein [Armatimonadota bacterium]
MFLLFVLALALAVALARGGSLWVLAGQHWRLPLLPVVAVVLQIVGFLPDEAASEAGRAFAAFMHGWSYLLAGAFIWANRRTPWLWLMALGVAANAAAVLANGGFMPVPPGASGAAAEAAARGYYNNAVLMSSDSPLWFLGDVLTVPSWWGGRWAVSAGDLAIAVATFGLVQRLTHPAGRGPDLPQR